MTQKVLIGFMIRCGTLLTKRFLHTDPSRCRGDFYGGLPFFDFYTPIKDFYAPLQNPLRVRARVRVRVYIRVRGFPILFSHFWELVKVHYIPSVNFNQLLN